jgi:Na+/melibiose symporter-like transporter
LQGGYVLANQLLGPPLGALLFSLHQPSPFAATAACYLLGAVLVSRIALRPRELPARRSVRHEVREGFVWLWHHPPVRTLAITIFLFNVTFGAAFSVLVLYADQRLGMSTAGYGWLATASALGGLVATASYGWLQRHFSLADLMRIGLVIETLTHLALAVTRQPWVALGVLFVFGAHAVVWGTTSTTVRQRAVPDDLQGRVGSGRCR